MDHSSPSSGPTGSGSSQPQQISLPSNPSATSNSPVSTASSLIPGTSSLGLVPSPLQQGVAVSSSASGSSSVPLSAVSNIVSSNTTPPLPPSVSSSLGIVSGVGSGSISSAQTQNQSQSTAGSSLLPSIPSISLGSASLAVSSSQAAIPPQVLRGLTDKFYEKRKAAALEIEKIVRDALVQNSTDRIHQILEILVTDYAYSVVPNSRNGGLISLAAVAIALGTAVDSHIEAIVPPILACFSDQDSRVRYYACESMYNVAKVARQSILKYFNEIFDALCKLSVDVEISVKNGAELLDRLIKDIVSERSLFSSSKKKEKSPTEETPRHPLSESPPPNIFPPVPGSIPLPPNVWTNFNLPRFIPLLSERIYVVSPAARLFLVQWIYVLNSVPDLDLITYLPEFLEGLLRFLSDVNPDVKTATLNVLGEFMKEIHEVQESRRAVSQQHVALSPSTTREGDSSAGDGPTIHFPRMIQILIPHLSSKDEDTQATALRWMNDFIILARDIVIPFTSSLLPCLLPSLSHPSAQIRSLAFDTNTSLFSLVLEWDLDKQIISPVSSPISAIATSIEKQQTSEPGGKLNSNATFDIASCVVALTHLFQHEYEDTRIASLEWLLMLHRKSPTKVFSSDTVIFQNLLRILSDLSEEVVKRDLQLLAQISHYSDDEHFVHFVRDLLTLFGNDRRLLESRGSLIIRQLCISLNPERMYKAFSDILENEDDLEFVSTMIQNLNLILVTAPELASMRKKMRNLDSKDGISLFSSLYKSWCHNAVSVFTLCLLAQAYEHASSLLASFADLEISVSFLIQIDKLVQLLESPVFTYLRLQLLEPEKNPALFKCLYGILMLLPQSSAFATLRNRLNSVSTLALLQVNSMPSGHGSLSSGSTHVKRKPSTNVASSSSGTSDSIKWSELLQQFKGVQSRHESTRRSTSSTTGRSRMQTEAEWYPPPHSVPLPRKTSLHPSLTRGASGTGSGNRLVGPRTSEGTRPMGIPRATSTSTIPPSKK